MRKPQRLIARDAHHLFDDAHALKLATECSVEKNIEETRMGLPAALERGTEIYGEVEDETYENVLTLDEAVTKYDCSSLGLHPEANSTFDWHDADDGASFKPKSS